MLDCEVSNIMTVIADKTVQSATYDAINEHIKTINVVSGHTTHLSSLVSSSFVQQNSFLPSSYLQFYMPYNYIAR